MLDLNKPTAKWGDDEMRHKIYVLRDESYQLPSPVHPTKIYTGPGIIHVTETGIGTVNALEVWPDNPDLWRWISALAGIGHFVLGSAGLSAQIPDELKTYWQRAVKKG